MGSIEQKYMFNSIFTSASSVKYFVRLINVSAFDLNERQKLIKCLEGVKTEIGKFLDKVNITSTATDDGLKNKVDEALEDGKVYEFECSSCQKNIKIYNHDFDLSFNLHFQECCLTKVDKQMPGVLHTNTKKEIIDNKPLNGIIDTKISSVCNSKCSNGKDSETAVSLKKNEKNNCFTKNKNDTYTCNACDVKGIKQHNLNRHSQKQSHLHNIKIFPNSLIPTELKSNFDPEFSCNKIGDNSESYKLIHKEGENSRALKNEVKTSNKMGQSIQDFDFELHTLYKIDQKRLRCRSCNINFPLSEIEFHCQLTHMKNIERYHLNKTRYLDWDLHSMYTVKKLKCYGCYACEDTSIQLHEILKHTKTNSHLQNLNLYHNDLVDELDWRYNYFCETYNDLASCLACNCSGMTMFQLYNHSKKQSHIENIQYCHEYDFENQI